MKVTSKSGVYYQWYGSHRIGTDEVRLYLGPICSEDLMAGLLQKVDQSMTTVSDWTDFHGWELTSGS